MIDRIKDVARAGHHSGGYQLFFGPTLATKTEKHKRDVEARKKLSVRK
jgi:hypothetical protein